MSKERKKRRFWEIDPTIFQPGPRASFFQRRVIGPTKSLGKYVLFGLAFVYPAALVVLGVMYGGLVFWSFLAGSMALIVLFLSRLGYANRFDTSKADMGRKMGGLSLGFLAALGFYYGLLYLRVWLVPAAFGVVAVAVVLLLRKSSSDSE